MLYTITDKFDKPFGVHECLPKELWAYLQSLPVQGRPYRVEADKAGVLFKVKELGRRHYLKGLTFAFGAGLMEGIHLLLGYFR